MRINASLALGAFLLAACGADDGDNSAACAEAEPSLSTEFDVDDPCFADFERSDDLNKERISSAKASISHNQGRNCMGCHQEAGPGVGLFTAAGTIYDESGELAEPGTLVKIFSDPMRTKLVAELETDKLGNIYTTEDLGLEASKRFISISSDDGELGGRMLAPKLNLSCNFCHDKSFPVKLEPLADMER